MSSVIRQKMKVAALYLLISIADTSAFENLFPNTEENIPTARESTFPSRFQLRDSFTPRWLSNHPRFYRKKMTAATPRRGIPEFQQNPKHVFTNLRPAETLEEFLKSENLTEFHRVFGEDFDFHESFPFTKPPKPVVGRRRPDSKELSDKLPLKIGVESNAISEQTLPRRLVTPPSVTLPPEKLSLPKIDSPHHIEYILSAKQDPTPIPFELKKPRISGSDRQPISNRPNIRTELTISGLSKPFASIINSRLVTRVGFFSRHNPKKDATSAERNFPDNPSSFFGSSRRKINDPNGHFEEREVKPFKPFDLNESLFSDTKSHFDTFPSFSGFSSASKTERPGAEVVTDFPPFGLSNILGRDPFGGGDVSQDVSLNEIQTSLPANIEAQVLDIIKPTISKSTGLVEPYVPITSPTNAPATTSQPNENEYRQYIQADSEDSLDPEFYLADLDGPRRFQPAVGGICITSFVERGVCVALNECPTLGSVAAQAQYGHIAQFLASNVCRYSEGEVYFCCSYYTFAATVPGGLAITPGPRKSPHFATLPAPSECGQVKVAQSRIVGGTPIEPGSWPWLAALGTPRGATVFQVTCSGSLITRRHVLSAAHCFYDPEDKNPTHVRLAENDVYSNDGPAEHQDFVIVARHDPAYYWTSKLNDLILVTLDRDVQYSDFIQPVCLPFAILDEPLPGRTLDATGFGLIREGARDTPALAHTVQLTVRELSRCEQSYTGQRGTPIALIDHRSICAGGDDGVGICNGDSGGPIHLLDPVTGRYTVVGVMIASNGCGLKDFASISTRVAPYLPWMMDVVTGQ